MGKLILPNRASGFSIGLKFRKKQKTIALYLYSRNEHQPE